MRLKNRNGWWKVKLGNVPDPLRVTQVLVLSSKTFK